MTNLLTAISLTLSAIGFYLLGMNDYKAAIKIFWLSIIISMFSFYFVGKTTP